MSTSFYEDTAYFLEWCLGREKKNLAYSNEELQGTFFVYFE